MVAGAGGRWGGVWGGGGGGLLQGWLRLLSGAGRGGRGVEVGCVFSLCAVLPAPRTLEESSWDALPQKNPVLSYGNLPSCLTTWWALVSSGAVNAGLNSAVWFGPRELRESCSRRERSGAAAGRCLLVRDEAPRLLLLPHPPPYRHCVASIFLAVCS